VNRAKSAALPERQPALGDEHMATSRSGGSKRGFAAMDPAKQREIASKGGKASHGGGRKAGSHR
jgi:general stress protein YciG